MKKITFFLILSLFAYKLSFSQLVSFNFNSIPYLNASSGSSNILVSPMALSSGTIETNITTGTYFTDEPYIEETGGWTETTPQSAKYYFITIEAQSGYTFTLTDLSYNAYSTASGPAATTVLVDNIPQDTINLPDAVLKTIVSNISDTSPKTFLTIKIAGWNNGSRATSGAGSFRLDDLIINGTVDLIPAKDSTSSLSLGSFPIPATISLLQTSANPLKLLELVFTDSASGDGTPTLIDSIRFVPNAFNQFSDWKALFDQVILKGPSFPEGILGIVGSNTILFNTSGILRVEEGPANFETYELWVALKSELDAADNKRVGFLIDSSQVYCQAGGSQVQRGKITTLLNQLKIEVIGTTVKLMPPSAIVFTDSLFRIEVMVTDVNGNIDCDDQSELTISALANEGILSSSMGLITSFENGYAKFDSLLFTGSDTVVFSISADDFGTFVSDPVFIGHHLFSDYFEQLNLDQWKYHNDWTVSDDRPLVENYSLKHNLTGVEGYSIISAELGGKAINDGRTVWRMIIRNGDFDPTSSNRFWYYLMASDSNLLLPQIFGYAIGVNVSGSTDTLSLWKVSNDGTKLLLVQSTFDWNTNDTVAIEVVRDVPGIWQLSWNKGSQFSNLTSSQIATDSSFSQINNHGLVYQYSSTRAGLLWADAMNFFQLNTPPVFLNAKGLTMNSVLLSFSENIDLNDAMDLNNYQLSSITDNEVIIDSVKMDLQNHKQLILYVNRLKTADYNLQVKNLADEDQSVMEPQTQVFSYRVKAVSGDVVFNEILFDPSPAIELPDYDFIELYNRSENPFYLGGWKLDIKGTIKTLPDSVIEKGGYIIITSSAAVPQYQTFGKTINAISTTDLTNTGKPLKLISQEGMLIDSIFYNPLWINDENKTDGGWSIERMDPSNLCGASGNWTVSVDEKGGSPGAKNSVFRNNIDTLGPKVLDKKLVSNTLLLIYFNEELDKENALLKSNWELPLEIGSIDTLTFSDDRKEVSLYLSAPIPDDISFQLQVSGITDLCDNVINDTLLSFLFHIPKPFDLVWNEIMADPLPVVGLPEADYLELYNRSSFSIEIGNWELWSGSVRKVLPEVTIEPGSYLLLCQNGFSDFYSDTISRIEILSTTTMPSGGTGLVLKDTSGTIIDSVFYLPSWYSNDSKEDGGWSLERIDPENHCSMTNNWQASVNLSGGTPGYKNSIHGTNIDTLPPEITDLKITGSNTLMLEFSEGLTENSINEITYYELNHNIGNPDSINYDADAGFMIELRFAKSFESPKTYQLSVKHLNDFCDNHLNDTLLDFIYYQPIPNDIVINEIMADPNPPVELPAVTYLELYNRSVWTIDLQKWKLLYGDFFRELEPYQLHSGEYLILCPTGQADQLEAFGPVMDILSSTTLTTTGKLLQLQDSTGQLITQVNYTKDWYGNAEKENGGWSLERIDSDNLCSSGYNWKASSNVRGGTPGTKNAVFASNPDHIQPKVSYWKVLDATRIYIEFSEPILADQLADSTNYILHGNYLSVKEVKIEVPSVELSVNTPFVQGRNYTIKVKGLIDECSNEINDTLLTFVFNGIEVNDLLFSELMVDEAPAVGLPEYEYIELYNRSSKSIQLENWILSVGGKPRNLPRYEIKPKKQLILCSESAIDAFYSFGNVLGISGFSALPNEKGTLQLVDTSNQIVCELNYYDEWYQDDEKKEGGWSLEIIDPERNCAPEDNWKASESQLGGTPGYLNSVNSPNQDVKAPSVSRFMPVSPQELWIEFDEIPDNDSKQDRNNYYLNSIGNPNSIQPDSLDERRVFLLFSGSMELGIKQQLTISNIMDNCNNIMKVTILEFEYYKPSLYEVVINEIMATPEPSAGLPAFEYLELFNTSDHTIYLTDWQLKVGSTTKTLPYGLMAPKSYLILTNSENAQFFSNYGKVMGIESFPSLPASGNASLYQMNNDFVCYTSWSSTWFTDDFKANGGYSLERMDPYNADESQMNWFESFASKGGTPGQQNSVYKSNPDYTAPDMVRAYPMSDTLVRVEFSESMDMQSFTHTDFELADEPDIISGITANPPNLWYFDLVLNHPIHYGITYSLEASTNVTDLAGNQLQNRDSKFALTSKATENGIVINELLYNPSATAVDFVELYNRSGFPVNLNQFLLATRDDAGLLKQLNSVSTFGAVLFPSEYVVLSTNQEAIKNTYEPIDEQAFYDMNSIPTYSDDEGTVVLLDTSGTVIDEFYYNDEMQFPLLQTTVGVSLERISPERPTNEKSNWHSASEPVSWATPGYQNSVYSETNVHETEIELEPESFSPDNDGYNDVVNFHYQFQQPGYVATISIFDDKGRKVRKLVENELLSTQGTISWDGLTDDQDKALMGIYLVYFEIYNLEGELQKYQKVCVVSAKL